MKLEKIGKRFLISGLGNPGTEYRATRHNVGAAFIEYLHQNFARPINLKNSFSSLYLETSIFDQKVILHLPQTYMNLSGIAVQKISSFYHIPTSNILVIHDELDLSFGIVKHKIAGGNAGHNGLKNIDQNIGNDYHRIRIGIDHPKKLGLSIQVSDYVLGRFTKEETDQLPEIFTNAEKIIASIIFA